MARYDLTPTLQHLYNTIRDRSKEIEELQKGLGITSRQLYYKDILDSIDQQIQLIETPFTIAFVGKFNSGKSTVINGLLKLKGESQLSTNDTEDTAKSIRVTRKGTESESNAKVIYKDGSTKLMTWEDAKKLTSQVSIQNTPTLQAEAEKVDWVYYYLDSPLLQNADIIDLPGTRTKNWSTLGNLTKRRMESADVIFWVISTNTSELSQTDILDLQSILELNYKVVPLINVWQDSERGISGFVSSEDLEATLRQQLEDILPKDFIIIKFFGQEIVKALAKNIKPDAFPQEWGYDLLLKYLENEIISDFEKETFEREDRIKDLMKSNLISLSQVVNNDREEYNKFFLKNSSISDFYKKKTQELSSLQKVIRGELKSLASPIAEEIIKQISSGAETFIRSEGKKIRNLFRAISGKEKAEKKLVQQFNKYLKLDNSPNWLETLDKSFTKDARLLIDEKWAQFTVGELKNVSIDNQKTELAAAQKEITNVSKDINNIAGINIIHFILEQIKILVRVVLFIEFFENFSKDTRNDNKMKKRIDRVVDKAKFAISNQEFIIKEQLVENADSNILSIYEEKYKKILRKKEEANSGMEELLGKLDTSIKQIEQIVEDTPQILANYGSKK